MITMPRYEVRHIENEEWIEITELELIDGLYELYRQVTPSIKKMIEGQELHTPNAVYRIKRQFGSPRITDINQRATSGR